MPDQFLYQELDVLSKHHVIPREIPDSIRLNLNPRFELREYQIEAFSRFFYCYKNETQTLRFPLHLLFNMATGSGKTLIMAGLILYLYEKGYRNFLFFVNSLNIIEKTKDNFLNPSSIKYLFNQEITIDNKRVRVTPVSNFEGVFPLDINICFTTIQKLHLDLTTEKENSITFEDFRKHQIVLISDESHHMNVSTKSEMELFESWENTVQNIFEKNSQNLLLEFTATHDFESQAMKEKYINKVIFRYDLQEFRNDGFSKDITIVYSDFELQERIIQALILNQYKQEVAARHRINLKPVILFKAQRTIAQSKENKEHFHKTIENLTGEQISRIRTSTIPIIQQAFRFFTESHINDDLLAKILKQEFQEDFCLSVNDDVESVNYQILVNTLEDKDNRIRAIFAVQKLNEGWDVLNLFDIVRCYETRDSGQGVIGKTTLSEAQLIGRGARYFPFTIPQQQDRFRRKFDNDLDHDLRVIEELHYHSINDSRYISEIRSALHKQGSIDGNEVTRELKLKDSFKGQAFYKYGLIYTNKRNKKDLHNVNSFSDLGVTRKNIIHTIATGQGGEGAVFNGNQPQPVITEERQKDIPLKEIERNLIQSAIARNPFYTFHSIRRFFPNLQSMNEFIDSDEYLGSLSITFHGNIYNLENNKKEKLIAVLELLGEIETEIRKISTKYEYEGSKDFNHSFIREVFYDKKLKFSKDNERVKDDNEFENFIKSQDWYVFDSLYGTSEEKEMVRLLGREIEGKYSQKYESIFLIRNEGHFAIYDFDYGQTFQPDFVLFLKEKNGQSLTYQLFIEPKGKVFTAQDQWKEDFLLKIQIDFADKVMKFGENLRYRLIGLPFYNHENENPFSETLNSALNS